MSHTSSSSQSFAIYYTHPKTEKRARLSANAYQTREQAQRACDSRNAGWHGMNYYVLPVAR